MQLVERAGGGTNGGGPAVVAARRAALSSLWRWLRVAGSRTEVDAQAAKRIRLLYYSVTAEQVNTLCAIIYKASADGMENGVSQRRAARSAAAQPERRKRRLPALQLSESGSSELI
jgi:hypothetical protein